MNWTIYGIECVGLLILFTCLIMIPLCRNPVWWIHDYPEDIQEKYFETHDRIPHPGAQRPGAAEKELRGAAGHGDRADPLSAGRGTGYSGAVNRYLWREE